MERVKFSDIYVIGKDGEILYSEDTVICHVPLEGYTTRGKRYEIQNVIPVHNRVSIIDDNGRECHARADRFTSEPLPEQDPSLC